MRDGRWTTTGWRALAALALVPVVAVGLLAAAAGAAVPTPTAAVSPLLAQIGLGRAAPASAVGVAIVDSGLAPVPALAGARVLRTGPGAAADRAGHGTHLAGIVAELAPDAPLVVVPAADADGTPDPARLARGLRRLAAHHDELGVRVVVVAAGLPADDPAVADVVAAVDAAWRAGLVVVVAAGNGGPGAPLDHPAAAARALVVGATDAGDPADPADDVVAAFSSTGVTGGRRPDLAAPGRSIASLLAPGSAAERDGAAGRVDADRVRGSGTSQAAAVAAAAVAHLLGHRPDLAPDEVRALLVATARPVPGGAALDLGRALVAPVPTTAAPAPAFGTVVADADGWTGRSWTGRSWTGRSWTGRSWTGRSWTGRSWTGRSWTGRSWTGRSWTGRSWTGRSWT